MMLRLVVFLSLLNTISLFGDPSSLFFIKHARTEDQKRWGLMRCSALPDNEGMLFHYSSPKHVRIWSFNCLIDLSVAFLDEQKRICEIQNLRAFPERMDPKRPVLSTRDFALYPAQDPIVIFFQKGSISSSVPVCYALEMNRGWFEKNRVEVGDVLEWNSKDNTAFFERRDSSPILQNEIRTPSGVNAEK